MLASNYMPCPIYLQIHIYIKNPIYIKLYALSHIYAVVGSRWSAFIPACMWGNNFCFIIRSYQQVLRAEFVNWIIHGVNFQDCKAIFADFTFQRILPNARFFQGEIQNFPIFLLKYSCSNCVFEGRREGAGYRTMVQQHFPVLCTFWWCAYVHYSSPVRSLALLLSRYVHKLFLWLGIFFRNRDHSPNYFLEIPSNFSENSYDFNEWRMTRIFAEKGRT